MNHYYHAALSFASAHRGAISIAACIMIFAAVLITVLTSPSDYRDGY